MAICDVENCEEYAAKVICPKHQKDVRFGLLEPREHWNVTPNPPCSVESCPRLANSRKGLVMCGVHQEHVNAGRDLATIRGKVRNHEPKPLCSEENCFKTTKTKGLCATHYSRRKNPSSWPKCARDRCDKLTPKGLCVDHRPRRVIRHLEAVTCVVPHCGREFKSNRNDICAHHRKELQKKGLTREQFLKLKSETHCYACGRDEDLVTDHHHAHHPGQPEVMCPTCIRGMLCRDCNVALGILEDSQDRLEKLITYLRDFTPGGLDL